MMSELNRLEKQIELLRQRMNHLAQTKGIRGQEVLHTSQELDVVLNRYEKMSRLSF
jgi:hypothetical protein